MYYHVSGDVINFNDPHGAYGVSNPLFSAKESDGTTFLYSVNGMYTSNDPFTCQRSDGVLPETHWQGYYGYITSPHYPVGTTTVTCTATDDNGQTGSASFTVTVNLTSFTSTSGPFVEIALGASSVSYTHLTLPTKA